LSVRRAIVTGGSRGIGRAVAAALAEQGWRVALLARDAVTLERARDELPGEGHEMFVLDVASEESWQRLGPCFEEVDGLVGSRRRSEFIVDAVRRQVQRARLGAAIESTAGILDPADYPEWETREKISAWVHESRDADRRPFEREPNDG